MMIITMLKKTTRKPKTPRTTIITKLTVTVTMTAT